MLARHRHRRRTSAAIALLLGPALAASVTLAACADAPASEPGGPDDLAATRAAMQVTGLADRGSTAGRHYFELYGDFPGGSYGARVVCGGAEVPSRREYASSTQINLSIPELPSGTSCSFLLFGSPYAILGVQDRGLTGDRRYFELYGSFAGADQAAETYHLDGALCAGARYPARVEWQSPGQVNVSVQGLFAPASCQFPLVGNVQVAPAFGPQLLTRPDVEIHGATDRGTTGGLRFFELYGRFSAASLAIQSICDGLVLPTTIVYASSGQVNVALAGFPGTADWGCGFTVTGALGARPVASPTFHTQASTAHPALPAFVGVYYWGGRLSSPGESQLATGTASLRAAGFQTARFVLSPRARGELVQNTSASLPYQIDTTALNAACPLGTPFLPCAIRSPAYQQAISAPGLRTIVLTTYDSTTSGDLGWSSDFMNRPFIDAHADAIVAEYRDLTLALHETQAGSNKTFIIANWESDNSLYCGSVYRYTREASFRAHCTDVPARLAGLRRWFELRQQGIRAGRQLAAERNLGGVTVADGIEFNTFHILDGWGPSTLADLIPHVRPDWASYSSYETINKLLDGSGGEAAVRAELIAVKRYLLERTAGTQLMIGEVGYPGSAGEQLDAVKTQQLAVTAQVLRLVHEAGIPVAILWVAHDSTPGFDAVAGESRLDLHDGFMNLDGTERLVLRWVRAALALLPALERPAVHGAVNVSASPTTSHVELYGNFPGASNASRRYAAKAICASALGTEVELSSPETYEGGGQVNIAVPRPSCGAVPCSATQRSCRFVVYRASDFTASAAFGPIVVGWP